MRSWIVVVVVVLLGPRLLKLLNRWLAYQRMQRMPLLLGTYSVVDEASVPVGTRRGFEDALADLARIGFVPIGYTQTPVLLPEMPWFKAVLWNAAERTFATLRFRAVAAPLGLSIDFVTLLEDGAWVWTVQGRRHTFISDFASGQLVDTLAADVVERWELHRGALAAEQGRRARDTTLAELCDFFAARDEEEIRLAVERGDARATADPRSFRFTPAGARAFLRRMEEGGRRVAGAKIGDPDLSRVPLEEQERHYRMAARAEELMRGGTWRIFVLSGIAFVASMLAWTSWSVIAWIVPVLLFHELGHWMAMRLLGHRDAWIAFIPFFGAATISAKRFDKLSHEIIVLLAGPVPGIVLGFALMFVAVLTRFNAGFLMQLAGLLVAINVSNLLPLHPLDGGRIVHALATAGRPVAGLAFRGIAVVAFVAAAIALHAPMLALVAAFTGFSFWQDIKRVRLEADIRRRPGFAATTSAEERRRFIFEALKGKPEGAPARWLANVRMLEVPLSHTRPGRLSAMLVGVAYVGFFVVAGYGISRFGSFMSDRMRCPGPSGAIALTCADATLPADAWANLPRPTRARKAGRARAKMEATRFEAASFVWCELPDQAAATALADRLSDAAENGGRYCTALPWEKTDDGTPEADHLRVRSTLSELRRAAAPAEDELAAVDALIARAQGRADFDAEMARTFRAAIADPRTKTEEEAEKVGARLGRSPTRSCDRIRLANVKADSTKPAVRLSVRLGQREDFGPLGRYLCEQGCRIQVLPLAADDLRAGVCF